MSQENKMLCPVCGSVDAGGAKASPYRCGSCGFGSAFVGRFAGKKSYELWRKQIDSAKTRRFRKMQENCTSNNTFYLCEKGIAYISPVDGRCYLTTSEPEEATEEQVMQYSASENHVVRLLKNGTVKAEGDDNTYHQCDVEQLENIAFVLAAPRCTYAVNKEGTVFASGSPVSSAVRNWTGIRTLACGSYHIAGLTGQGTVISEGLAEQVAKKISQWKDVTYITAANDCTLALHSDGKVSFAGREGDVREAEVAKWENIAAIAVDSIYAVGLTKDGQVVLAGVCKKDFLDMGRKNAAEWKDVVAISCSRSGIAALQRDGSVKLAGNIRGIAEVQEEWKKKAPKVQSELQQGAVL